MIAFGTPLAARSRARFAGLRELPDVPATPGEVSSANFDAFRFVESSDSFARVAAPALRANLQAFAEDVGDEDLLRRLRVSGQGDSVTTSQHLIKQEYERKADAMKPWGGKTYEQIMDEVSEQAQEVVARRDSVNARAMGVMGGISAFAGTMGAAMLDPLNLISLPFGYGVGKTALRAVVAQGVINMGIEAAIQPSVVSFKKQLGLDHSTAQALNNILAAGVGGAAFEGAGRVLGAGYRALKGRGLITAKPVADAADEIAQQLEIATKANPFPDVEGSAQLNLKAMDEATDAVMRGRIPGTELTRQGLRHLDDDPLAAALRGVNPEGFEGQLWKRDMRDGFGKGELRQIAKERGLSSKGTKAEIIDRIFEDAQVRAEPLPAAPDPKLEAVSVKTRAGAESITFGRIDEALAAEPPGYRPPDQPEPVMPEPDTPAAGEDLSIEGLRDDIDVLVEELGEDASVVGTGDFDERGIAQMRDVREVIADAKEEQNGLTAVMGCISGGLGGVV